jgi:hypothetical protein
MKKKYRIKTWDELKNMDGVKLCGDRVLMFKDCLFTDDMKCLSGKIIEMDFDEDNDRYHFSGVGYVRKWMCEELPQFKEGDLVLARYFGDKWADRAEKYLMTSKDGLHICEFNSSVRAWDEIKPYIKQTTALEDLIKYRDNYRHSTIADEKIEEIIKKLKLGL